MVSGALPVLLNASLTLLAAPNAMEDVRRQLFLVDIVLMEVFVQNPDIVQEFFNAVDPVRRETLIYVVLNLSYDARR